MHVGIRYVYGKLPGGCKETSAFLQDSEKDQEGARAPEAGRVSAGGKEEETLPESQDLSIGEAQLRQATRGVGPGVGSCTRTLEGLTWCWHLRF